MANFKNLKSAGAVLAILAVLNLGIAFAPPAYADDCLLDTNNDGNADTDVDTDGGAFSSGNAARLACGPSASASGDASTALGFLASAAGDNSVALGREAGAAVTGAIALGYLADAAGGNSVALGRSASAPESVSIAIGNSSDAAGTNSIAIGSFAEATMNGSVAIGNFTDATGLFALALGGGSGAGDIAGPNASGDNSIVIGTEATDAGFADTIIVGRGASASEAGQVVLKDADIFTILGNGDMGLGTATPAGNLDVNSGAADTLLVLTNDTAQWAIKSNAANGKLTIGNNTTGTKPLKFGPNAVGNLLQIGIVATDQVDIKGNLVTTGTLTTGGPTCGGGCDAVFDADYDLLSIEDHAALMYANKHLPAVGPTVPHAPLNISEQYGRMLNELEKAHIYIAQNHREKQALRTELEDIKQQVALLMNK